ncbi:MAG: hypothetical protein A2Z34_02830 [Planctomycetes bacterium RBG_16_59_8]|nr:MAG: hypothetical protein A2Z34_02830 [Planctomycetes bacterium RBG_16_59_8]
MKTYTARQLKNRTGEVLRTIRSGESAVITLHGKPVGTIQPISSDNVSSENFRPIAEVWVDIERELAATRPRFRTWREAERAMRSRE